MNKKRSLILKIVVPVLIVVVIVGLYVIKNLPKESEKQQEIINQNPDFALTVTEPLDMDALKAYGLPILIEFGSESCPPCQQMVPVIEALNEELQGKAIIKYMDVWETPDWAEGYPLTVIPTQLFIDSKGNPYNPADPDVMDMLLYSMKDTGEHVYTTHEGIISKDDLLIVLKEMGMQE